MSDGPRTLDGIKVLSGTAPEARRALAQRCRWQRYDSGQQVVGHLDETRDVFFVVQGCVRAIAYSLSGKEVSYRDIAAGDVVGEFSAIDGAARSADVIAVADTLLASLSADAYWKVLTQHPEVAAATLKSLTRQLRDLTERVFEFSTLAVNNRLHAELLRLARLGQIEENTAVIAPAPTHAALASRISTHREAVTRELNALARTGLVERNGNALRIRDVAKLSQMVELVRGDLP